MSRVMRAKLTVIGVFLVLLISFAVLFSDVAAGTTFYTSFNIRVLSIVGWGTYIVSLTTWKTVSGRWFSLYSIFLSFAYLFTFGQCLMWAIGIHTSYEIGKTIMYTLPAPTQSDIIKTQLVTIICLFSFHVGAILKYNSAENSITITEQEKNADTSRKILFQVCIIANVISTPLMMWSIVRNILINSRYGYGAALYNANVVATQNNLVLLLRLMYIPSLLGLLITSKYDKRVVRISYINFALFMVLGILAGDRGEWLFPLLLLIWMHHKCCKKIVFRQFLRYVLLAIVFTVLAVAVRNSRSRGITISGLHEAIVGEKNPLVSAVFELGSSMKPALVVVRHGKGIYPYGNSYIHAFAGMITERLIMIVQPNYMSLSGWFSRSFLGINYGAGFSIVAEAIINYGIYGSIIVMMILGGLFSWIMFSVETTDYVKKPIKMFLGVSTAYAMLQTIRNTLLVATKTWFFSTVTILLMYFFYSNITRRNNC